MHSFFCGHCIAGAVAAIPLIGVGLRWAIAKYRTRKGMVAIEIITES